jgi:hypothetical protein
MDNVKKITSFPRKIGVEVFALTLFSILFVTLVTLDFHVNCLSCVTDF